MLVLITALGPVSYRGRFRARPGVGLLVWFGTFGFGLVTTIAAISVTIWSMVELFNESIRGQIVIGEILSHIGIWVALALGGIALALINHRTENYFLTAKAEKPNLDLVSRQTGEFHGVPIRALDLPVPLAFSAKINRRSAIMISEGALEVLSEAELQATLWHEWAHIKKNHFALKAVGRLIKALTPKLRASHLLQVETDELMELIADQVASAKVGRSHVLSARVKLSE